MRRVLLALCLLAPLQAQAQIPNYRELAESIGQTANLRTLEGCGEYTRRVALAAAMRDANFGHLRKPSFRTHVVDRWGDRHAADVILYRATGQIVDIARDCAGLDPAPDWQPGHVGEYNPDALIDGKPTWFSPNLTIHTEPTPPTPTPIPPTSPPTLTLDLSTVHLRLDYLDQRVQALGEQAERIYADEAKRHEQTHAAIVAHDAKVEGMWTKVGKFITDPRTLIAIAGVAAGWFAAPNAEEAK